MKKMSVLVSCGLACGVLINASTGWGIKGEEDLTENPYEKTLERHGISSTLMRQEAANVLQNCTEYGGGETNTELMPLLSNTALSSNPLSAQEPNYVDINNVQLSSSLEIVVEEEEGSKEPLYVIPQKIFTNSLPDSGNGTLPLSFATQHSILQQLQERYPALNLAGTPDTFAAHTLDLQSEKSGTVSSFFFDDDSNLKYCDELIKANRFLKVALDQLEAERKQLSARLDAQQCLIAEKEKALAEAQKQVNTSNTQTRVAKEEEERYARLYKQEKKNNSWSSRYSLKKIGTGFSVGLFGGLAAGGSGLYAAIRHISGFAEWMGFTPAMQFYALLNMTHDAGSFFGDYINTTKECVLPGQYAQALNYTRQLTDFPHTEL